MLQQTVCALRFLYRNTLGKEWALPYIPTPRREKRLPVVLSQEEVSRFFDNLPNLKHRALIMTAYATGMRVSEVVSLRVADIDSDRMMIRVELGKGSKDRLWAAAHKRSYVPEKVMCRGITSITRRHQLLASAARVMLGGHST
jgi:site-specific recombinase XerD